MKTLPVALAAHLATRSTTLGHLLLITRADGQIFAFASGSDDVTISGTVYRSAPGLDVSSIETTSGLAVGNLELTTLDDGTTFTRIEVLAGVWRNAAFLISRYNWAAPANGTEPFMAGTIGEVEIRRNTVVAELRGLQQYLQQSVGNVTTKNCRARLGDSLCTANLVPFTVTGATTAVASSQVFTDTARAESAGWFDEGELLWLTGLNEGLRQKVKVFSGGQFTLSLPMVQVVQVGDTYSVYAGCRKRLEDCRDKFNNVLNFQGEPHLPGVDALTKPPA